MSKSQAAYDVSFEITPNRPFAVFGIGSATQQATVQNKAGYAAAGAIARALSFMESRVSLREGMPSIFL